MSGKNDVDSQDLNRLGYAQELFRGMGGFSNFAMSFSIISILTGATQLYGYGLQHGGPLQMTLGWGVVSFFTLFVALSMAELASAYPTSGALYHWSTFLGGKRLGWWTACLNTIGQFAILAGIDYGLAQFLAGLFHLPESRVLIVILYLLILISHAALNHLGIQWVAWLNRFSAAYHMGVVALLFGLLFYNGFSHPISFVFEFHSSDTYSPYYSFAIGLLLAQWTLTGFDASAHVTEETIDPRRNAPWGIFLAVAISVVLGWVMLVGVTLSMPGLSQSIAWGDQAFAEILKHRLGETTGTILTGMIGGAMWLCGLSCLTSASRMVYAFARDGGLPGSQLWARVSPIHKTPANAIWMLTALSVLLIVSVEVFSSVVSVATIALYISYGLPIFAKLWARKNGIPIEKGPWHLGRLSLACEILAVFWVCTICVIFVLPPHESAGGALVGCLGILLVLWYSYAKFYFKGPSYQPPHVLILESPDEGGKKSYQPSFHNA